MKHSIYNMISSKPMAIEYFPVDISGYRANIKADPIYCATKLIDVLVMIVS